MVKAFRAFLYKKYRFKINPISLLEKEKPQFKMYNLN